MATLCGADGCKNGWVLAIHELASGDTRAQRASSIEDIFNSIDDLAMLAIDVPIGLPDAGPRACDLEARAMLGRPRGSSVFPAPIRPMLSAASHPDACSIGRRSDGRGLPVQCWHIIPKIREVDDCLRESAARRARTREVHPEVSFMLLAGRPMRYPKRTLSGRLERLALLEPLFGDTVSRAIGDRKALDAKPDDILDAFIALWSAMRITDQTSIGLPRGRLQVDREGIRMEIRG